MFTKLIKAISFIAYFLAITFIVLIISGKVSIGAEVGRASWYKMGHTTANGERYNPDGLTCAHRTFKFGTRLKITNLKNKRSAVCRVNDRGPFIRGRIVDVSRGMARKLKMISSGVVKVRVEKL